MEKGKGMEYKTDVETLGKVFESLESINFPEIPVFNENNKIEEQFVTTLVLTLARNKPRLNDFFSSITGKSAVFTDKSLDELCEVAQGFFENIPERFKGTIKTMIKEQKRQKAMAMNQMTQGMQSMINEMKENLILETDT